MRYYIAFKLISIVALVASIPWVFMGCGSKYESTDEFLNELPTEKQAGDSEAGSLPPIGDPIDEAARLRVETNEFDMGTIKHDELGHGRLNIYNDGEMPLKISKIDTTCACTQGHIAPENAVIEAGGSSWIDIVVDPRRIPGFHTRKVLSIYSTDMTQSVVTVEVSSKVDPEFDIGPEIIEVGDIPKGERFEKHIRFRQLIDKPVNILQLKPYGLPVLEIGDPDIVAEVRDVPENEWNTPGHIERDLVISFEPDMPAGAFSRKILLETDIRGGSNRMPLTFTGTIIAPYDVSPPLPDCAELGPGELPGTYVARFKFTSATPISIGTIATSDDSVTAAVVPGDSPTEAIVELSSVGPPPEVEPRFVTAEVEVHANGASYTEKIGVSMKPQRATPPPASTTAPAAGSE